jgi:hypothetical protein
MQAARMAAPFESLPSNRRLMTRHDSMTNRPLKTSAKQPGIDPRFEITFELRPPAKVALSSLFSVLKSYGERAGSALGDAYARVAGSILNEKERLEDLNAERRIRPRSHAARGPASRAPAPSLAISPEEPQPSAK